MSVFEVDEEGSEPDELAKAIDKRMFTLRNIYPVNEEGTEAAAATGVMMMTRAMVIVPSFVADRPFIYGIFRESEPIFIGQYC
ncbi:hypothetical protein COOONC_22533 [Cooperia oncophora]